MPISADDLPAISALLDTALDLPASSRRAWLDSLPPAQQAYRDTLEQMLARHADAESADFLGALPRIDADPEPVWDSQDEAGERTVGPYRLIREIGRGGMGQVWLAERRDGMLKRQVALKLPHPALGTRDFAERLARERDILASLAHPHIARLYDAGVTAQGQPYMALAFVEGQTLIAHCDAARLTLRQRIALFLQVLDAVQFAHAHLVIHRDIKPSNVMVDAAGQVQLLDFGIAKLVVDGQAEATELTLEAGQRLTPDYASPEQIAGAQISTASDVYSLGVLLYELLAGERPYTLQFTHGGLKQAILAVDPRLPSTIAREPATARALRGDLDAILMKALQKPVGLRYATAEALALDLKRHLDGEPVLAQPCSAMYRVRKFVGRHRLPTAFAAASIFALVIGAGLATWQASVATRERDTALRLLSRNQAVSEFLDLFITEAAQSPTPLTAAELLARSEKLADNAFGKTPEHQALVLSILSAHQFDLSDGERAEALATRAIEGAKGSGDASFQARLECQRAFIRVASKGDPAARETLLAQARRADIDPASAAECYDALSYSAQLKLDGAAAVDFSRQALAHHLAGARPSEALEAEYRGTLGYALHLDGRNAEAETEFARSLGIFTRLGRDGSSHAMNMLANWATANGNAGDARASLAHYDQIVAALDKRGIGDAPPAPEMKAFRARALAVTGRTEAAGAAYEQALAAAGKIDDPGSVFVCLLGLATIAMDSGRVDDAEQLLHRMEGVKATGSMVARGLHAVRARVAQARGRFAEAAVEYDAGLKAAKTVPTLVAALLRRAEYRLSLGETDAAASDAASSLENATRLQGGKPWSVHTGTALWVDGRIRAAQGDMAKARAEWQQAVAHLSNTVDDAHPALRSLRALLADASK